MVLKWELFGDDKPVICFGRTVDETDRLHFTPYRLPLGLETLLFGMRGPVLELSDGEVRVESASKARCVVIIWQVRHERVVETQDVVFGFWNEEHRTRFTVFERVETCKSDGKWGYLLRCFCKCWRNRSKILTFSEWIEERYMWHPPSEVPVVNATDGLDRRLHGFWWDEDDCCRMCFVWHK